jgi:hypothetical protein
LKKYDESISIIARKLGGKGVADLERLATALYVTHQLDDCAPIEKRAETLTMLKPHIALMDAMAANIEVDKIIAETSR